MAIDGSHLGSTRNRSGLQHHLAQHLTQHLATVSRCLEVLNFMLSLFLSVENLPIRLEALH